jgi:hypothetical protein
MGERAPRCVVGGELEREPVAAVRAGRHPGHGERAAEAEMIRRRLYLELVQSVCLTGGERDRRDWSCDG